MASLKASADRVARTAVTVLPAWLPAKRARAIMGVKFQGCGSNRAQAARTTIPIHKRFDTSMTGLLGRTGVLLIVVEIHAANGTKKVQMAFVKIGALRHLPAGSAM